jgi:hypothetical protein
VSGGSHHSQLLQLRLKLWKKEGLARENEGKGGKSEKKERTCMRVFTTSMGTIPP